MVPSIEVAIVAEPTDGSERKMSVEMILHMVVNPPTEIVFLEALLAAGNVKKFTKQPTFSASNIAAITFGRQRARRGESGSGERYIIPGLALVMFYLD
jgi:hypothetical protein